ncbi:MAG: ATP-binding protein [Haliscomenobacter sp.]|uniref:sensor histidine kinase n=1 Tax=Haliscomenobacter sp. TaxID=2717303 RepID=UPI0029AF5E32|nr:ATP-binding protein [Haliscomenobacter sp.]MDX2072310.1 ATP-binding protein [Haliscomenobacter sp.]
MLLGISSSVFSQNDLIFNELNSKNGLEDAKIAFVYKDSRGFSWIGALGSLYRFDGSEVLPYGQAKGVDEPYLQSSMFEDKRGNLWFCAYNKLFCYERLRDTCLSFGGFFEKNGVETLVDYGLIHLDQRDQLWVTAGGGIFCLKIGQTLAQQRLSFQSYSIGKEKIQGKSFYPLLDQNGELIGFFEYLFFGPGMKVWTKQAKHSFSSKAFFSNEEAYSPPLEINEILPVFEKKGQYILTSEKVIGVFNSSNGEFTPLLTPPMGLSFFFTVYTQPHILLLSTNEGLHYFNIQTKHLSKVKDWPTNQITNDISRNNFKRIYLDRDNILWASAFDERLCFTDPNLFKTSFTKFDFNADCWLEVAPDVWLFGTSKGLQLVKKGKAIKSFLNLQITRLYKDLEKRIWVLTEKGFYIFDPKNETISRFGNDQGYVFSFFQSTDSTFWVGNNTATKKMDYANKKIIDVNVYTGQLLGSTSIWEDTQYRRIYLHENVNNLHILQYREGDWKKDTVFVIKGYLGGHLIPKGTDKIWVATMNGIKLIHRTKATIEDLPLPSTWPNTNFKGMVQDQQGTIWVSTNTHILCFDADGRPVRIYTPKEGFLAGPFSNEGIQILADQSIGIIGQNGLNRFFPTKRKTKKQLPKIQLTKLTIQGTLYQKLFPHDTSISEKRQIRLKYRQNSITLRLVGIELGQPDQVKLQYYLKGWEKKTEASNRNQFAEPRYNKLAPGTYTLMVRAANANGEWTSWKQKLRIEIVPPIRMRWWFILLEIIAGIALVAGIAQLYYRAQLREARIRNEEQERILRDIHDLTSGKVVFFQDFQSFAEQEIQGTEAKAKALGIAQQALQLFKRISAAVRNNTESDSTLLEFLQQLIAESKKNAGEALHFSAKIDTSIPYAWVAGEYKKQLRLVVQEAIGNTLKHAQATSLLLNIKVKEGKLKIVLQDNGIGIPEPLIAQIKPTEKVQDSGNGLGNMLARVQQIGGEIKWINHQGTMVLISIFLNKIRPRRKIFLNFMRFLLF